MKRNILYFVFLLLVFSYSKAQQVYLSDTKGELTVNGMGAANYKVPIALPPGIKDVAPQIALTYSSSGNNGIAGYGWNIVGISSITRIGTRIDLDGYVDGVDFDANDQFALDGQRLIKDGNQYYTENYSNLKIESTGTYTYPGASGSGPEKFTITFADGTQAFYGSTTNSRGVSEWLIDKWIDPKGNTIKYDYEKNSSDVTYIKKISWSENANIGTNGYVNTIEFTYKQRSRPEMAYLHGVKMVSTWMLDYIIVKTGGEQFRKYVMTHAPANELKYQNLSQIQEFNGNNEPANPIVFNYSNTPQTVDITSRTYMENITEANINPQHLGDFDGDGLLDAVIDNKLYLNLFNPIGGNTTTIDYNLSTINIRKAPVVVLDESGKLSQSQSIIRDQVNNAIGDYTVLQSHKVFITPNKFNISNNLFEPVFTREVSYPHLSRRYVEADATDCPEANLPTYMATPSKKYIEGDFDGDGVSDLILLGQTTDRVIYIMPESDPNCTDCIPICDYYYESGQVPPYFISMNSQIPDVDASFRIQSSEFHYNSTLHVLDFDGDGKQDIMSIRSGNAGDTGYYKIYTLNKANQTFDIICTGFMPEYDEDDEDDVAALFFGDFNGDAKIDVLTPKGIGNSSWSIYFSTGKSFVKQDVNIREYIEDFQGNAHRGQYVYKVLDLNKDGKSDFVSIKLENYNAGGNGTSSFYEIDAYMNMNNSGSTAFQHFYYKKTTSGRPFPGLPITGEFKSPSANFELMILKDDSNARTVIDAFDFRKDQSKDMRLSSVSEVNGKILSEITYAPLEPNTANGGMGDVNGTYFSSNSESYPFVEIKRLPHLNVVTKLKVSALGNSKEKEFKYFGLTSHSHGWGLLGFKKMAQSSWVTSGIDTKIWQVALMSPTLRGVSTGSWSFSGNNLSLITNPVDSQLLSKSTLWYTQETLSQNRYVLLPYQREEKDILTGVTKTTVDEFDTYYNLKKSTLSVGGTNASYVTNYEYENNHSGTGTNYYIGRLKKKNTTSTAYGDTRTSEVKYTYTGTQLTKTETKGHNTDYITETFGYDGYGNIIQTTTSAPGVSSRTISNEYDNNGRFVKKKTDVDGLITNLTYNKLGQVLTLTDPFNVTTTSIYDNWGKLMTVTISGASTTPLVTSNGYSRDSSGLLIVTSDNAQTKEYSETHTDVLGRTFKTITKGFGSGTKIAKTTEYDFLGRVTRESEPYFTTGSPTQWNSIEYDNLSRPIKQTAFTTKVTNISYNGLAVTTSENGKTKTITKDAIGNVASVSDNGQVLNYGYYANNELKSTTYGNHTVTIGIDGWGRKISLLDPSVSSTAYTYSYNNYGETLQETTPNGVTTYTYTSTGRLNTKTITGDNTNISVTYQYNNKGQIEREYGTSNSVPHSTRYYYDTLNRLNRKNEEIGQNNFEKLYSYDSFGRVSTETTNVGCTTCINILGASSTLTIKNNYNTYNGILDHITDNGTNATIWKLTGANQRMQTLSAQLGNGVNIANTYTTHGYIQNIRHTKSSITPLSLDYTFDAPKGTLTNRKNNFYNYTENFTYDNFDRLLSWTTPTGVESNNYEPDGRIQSNSNIGSYAYDATAKYKKKDITLTTNGKNYYSGRNPQQVVYNAFKKPVTITEENRGTIEFQYGIYGIRNKAIDWNNTPTNPNTEVSRTKLYSSDGSVEIILKGAEAGPPDQGPGGIGTFGLPTEPFLRIITYIGGNAYSAPAMYVKTYSGTKTSPSTNEQYHYLHRDFQGSIMAITNQAGTVIERRHYDAWGNVSKYTNSLSATQTNPNFIGGEMFFDRGYTGHEHFFRVGIIHMNGRIYDPVLKGFMSPDNFVQDPQNSQNFNRYAYCLNNPLMYTDPSGEVFQIGVLGAMAIGAAIAATSYTIYALATTWDNFSWGGLLKSTLIGAVSGAASFGVGQLASQMFTGICASTSTLTASQVSWIVAAPQAVMHGISQGFIAGISGGDLGQAFFSGMISSGVSSVVQMGGSSFMGNGDAATLLFGTVSGGLSAELTGGNFWEGAATGLVVSGLNHTLHKSALNAKIDSEFEGTGLDPDGNPDVNTVVNGETYFDPAKGVAEAEMLSSTLPVLSDMSTEAGCPKIVIKSGGVGHKAIPGRIGLTPGAFLTYRKLALMLGHEYSHLIPIVNGTYSKWKKFYPNQEKLDIIGEYNAYKWESEWGGNYLYDTQSQYNHYLNQYKQLSPNFIKTFGF